MNNKIDRNSRIELLKVLAIFMIVISHSLPRDGSVDSPWYVNIRMASSDYKHVALSALSYLGQIGNGIFMVCSAWFLAGREDINKKRIVNLWVDTLAVSWVFLLACFILFHNLSVMDIVESVMPVTFQSYWFVTCYICFYCIVPYLNMILNKVGKQVHFQIIVLFVFIYMFINMIIPIAGEYYYASDLVSFIQIFFMVSYLKMYHDVTKMSFKVAILVEGGTLLTLISMVLLINIIGLKISSFSTQMLHGASTNNPLIIISVIFFFIIFYKIKPTNNTFINRISSLSLLIYLLSANPLYSYYIRPLFYSRIVGEIFAIEFPLLSVFILTIMQFVFSCILANVYEKLFSGARSCIVNKVISVSMKVMDTLYCKFG